MSTPLSHFAETIMQQKYAHTKEDGSLETWDDIAERVATAILKDTFPDDIPTMTRLIRERKFMPGGRYLYAAGREFQAINNCFLLRAEDSREGWAKLMHDAVHCLMSGGGIGVNYSSIRPYGAKVGGLGGICTGPLALMEAVNETARQIQAGGSRRAAVYASLHWWHPDALNFVRLKDWDQATKDRKAEDFNARAPMDMTNISIALDDDFFDVMEGRVEFVSKTIGGEVYTLDYGWAEMVYDAVVSSMLTTGEPGFQIDLGDKSDEILRNACLPGHSRLLTPNGLTTMLDVKEGDTVWSSDGWVKVTKKWDKGAKLVYAAQTSSGTLYATEDHEVVQRGVKVELRDAKSIDTLPLPGVHGVGIDPQRVMDGLFFGDGYAHKASNGQPFLCIGTKDQDYFKSEVAHLIGSQMDRSATDYRVTVSHDAVAPGSVTVREVPSAITGGSLQDKASWLRGFFSANGSVTAGTRISAKSTNQDAIEAIQAMLWELGISSYMTFNKEQEITWSNGTYKSKPSVDLNINNTESVNRFGELIGFLQDYKNDALTTIAGSGRFQPRKILNRQPIGLMDVFDIEVDGASHTFWTDGLSVSNCTEVTSSDHMDVCNLGSLNIAAFDSIREWEDAILVATRFLLAGTVVGDVPNDEVAEVRNRNRRLGLGIMGFYDWLVGRGHRYAPNAELARWLDAYSELSDWAADLGAYDLGISTPVAVRSIAPTGTIGILAEVTSGIEPLFATAYKRRYLKGETWHYQYVVDQGAKRLQEVHGVHPDKLETAYDLAYDPERRLAFQAFVQQYVDQAISSTLNLPNPDEHAIDPHEFGDMLYKYLPQLRGVTTYPDGARGGQPLTVVSYEEASQSEGLEFEEFGAEQGCKSGVCGL